MLSIRRAEFTPLGVGSDRRIEGPLGTRAEGKRSMTPRPSAIIIASHSTARSNSTAGMTTRHEDGRKDQALARFLERIRKSVTHDLRTPLGTIVNYAAVLEANQGSDPEEVRDLGRRIRSNAQRAARMVQMMATAVGLASRPSHIASTDLMRLARSVLTDANGRGMVRLGRETHETLADVDAELLGFVWRAYVAVESDTLGKPVDEAELVVVPSPDSLLVELSCAAPADSIETPRISTGSEGSVELQSYLRHNGGPARLESSMGLGLAQDLIASHGDELEVWGRPGVRSGLRVRFPSVA